MLVLPTPPLPLVMAITRVGRWDVRTSDMPPGEGPIDPSLGSDAFFIRLSIDA
jgi:hypothetical protein